MTPSDAIVIVVCMIALSLWFGFLGYRMGTRDAKRPECKGQISATTHVNGVTHTTQPQWFPAHCVIVPKSINSKGNPLGGKS